MVGKCKLCQLVNMKVEVEILAKDYAFDVGGLMSDQLFNFRDKLIRSNKESLMLSAFN